MQVFAFQLSLGLALAGPGDPAPVTSSARLQQLSDGPTKRQFILDCTGCHQFDAQVTRPNGAPRTRDEWVAAVQRMLGYAGARTGFPVIAAGRDPEATADWLRRELAGPGPSTAPAEGFAIGEGEIREYPIPEPGDLPHDLAVDAAGRVVITGMFSQVMYQLDPASGEFSAVPLPAEKGGPRAVEIDGEGQWWVLLSGPGLIARFAPATGKWKTWPLGMYPHSIALDSSGRAWFNGHFSRDPEVIGRIDPATGVSKVFPVPAHPTMGGTPGGPIPYELRIGPDGRIWGSELQGNRIFGLTPSTGEFTVYELPTPLSGPRRFDVAPNGDLWIPAYAANRLLRFEPASAKFTEYALPIPDALPYVARVDPDRNVVWVGTGAADAALSFDLATRRFTVYPLPSRGALVRHLSIDPRTHDLWLAYGAAPGRIPARVARLRVK
jgi:virginiamycin B lyase